MEWRDRKKLLVLINNYIEKDKTRLLSRIYIRYLQKRYNWNSFCELSDALSRCFLSDLNVLDKIYEKNLRKTTNENNYIISRLEGIGFVSTSISGMVRMQNGQLATNKFIYLTSMGQKFCDAAFHEWSILDINQEN